MRIASTQLLTRPAPPPPPPPAETPRPPADQVQLGGSQFWRDYGINPMNMFRRGFVDRPLSGGTQLRQSKPANNLVTDSVRAQLHGLLQGQPDQAVLEQGLDTLAKSFGVSINFQEGVPIVNWDPDRPAVLDARYPKGTSAYHELVHVVQCTIGGCAALGTAAAEKFQAQHGRAPRDLAEIQSFIPSLNAEEKRQAMDGMVVPMEDQAYSTFEQAAFHATGLMGKRAKNQELYRTRLGEVVEAYCHAYQTATVPNLETATEAKVYGSIGHIARTNGETALLVGGAGLAYYHLGRQAMKIHPLMAIPVATPLAVGLYRALVTG